MSEAAASPRLLRAFGGVLSILLVGILGALVWGHMGGALKGLSLYHSYITEYGFAAPHWPWIVVATFGLASVLFLLAVAYLLQVEHRLFVTAGCVLMAASSMTLFFVSYAPVRRMEQSGTATHVWGPRWWFESRTSQTDYEDGLADAYSDVHYHAIRLFVINGLLGQALMAIGLFGLRAWKRFAEVTMAAVVCMAALFVLCDQANEWRGLWQRLGFALMYLWLWTARWHLTNVPFFRIQQDRTVNAQVMTSGKSVSGASFPA
jgi:hypothetical protein